MGGWREQMAGGGDGPASHGLSCRLCMLSPHYSVSSRQGILFSYSGTAKKQKMTP